MQIILASKSPRRQELLKKIYPNFEIITSDCEENAIFQNPEQYVKDLSLQKAEDVYQKLLSSQVKKSSEIPSNESIIIGSDTIVYLDGKVLGKPQDQNDAFHTLKDLSDKKHQVYTGVTILYRNDANPENNLTIQFAEKTDVYVSQLTDAEINDYIATDEPMDKAGSYGIQGFFAKHISKIDGDYFSVVGLPVSHLYEELRNNNLL